jgi:naphthoate synthase
MSYETILYEEDGAVGWLTLNRPDDGNMFTATMCLEIRDCIEGIRRETRTRVLVITGAGDQFFCLGGRKEGMEKTNLYAGVLPTLDMYEAIDRLQKPVIASVNGYAVGGGKVLQVVCDLSIAKESAIFRQVGPMVGSFDAGFGTWYLEDLVGKRVAKELWMTNRKLTAAEALDIGLVNRVVPDGELRVRTTELANEVADRGSFALAAIKHAFHARHSGVTGMSRVSHDLLLRGYLDTEEAHELSAAEVKSAGSTRRARWPAGGPGPAGHGCTIFHDVDGVVAAASRSWCKAAVRNRLCSWRLCEEPGSGRLRCVTRIVR